MKKKPEWLSKIPSQKQPFEVVQWHFENSMLPFKPNHKGVVKMKLNKVLLSILILTMAVIMVCFGIIYYAVLVCEMSYLLLTLL